MTRLMRTFRIYQALLSLKEVFCENPISFMHLFPNIVLDAKGPLNYLYLSFLILLVLRVSPSSGKASS